MNRTWNRRQVLKAVAANTALLLTEPTEAAGAETGIRISAVSSYTFRLTVSPLRNGQFVDIPTDGSLIRGDWPMLKEIRGIPRSETIKTGELTVKISAEPLTFRIENSSGKPIQQLTIDQQSGAVQFELGNAPVLGLGEGGPQFDRRGSVDSMRNGQGGPQFRTLGARLPIPWLIGTAGWAMFIHFPYGQFDLSGTEGKFLSSNPLPLDIFFVGSREPAILMAEYARLTGHAQLPALWTLGYQQSHRTLASYEEVMQEAKTFRDKKLPCDAMIYLGTGFCPSGWNTANGSFEWNRHVFPDPKAAIDRLHADHFRVVLHAVILSDRLDGTVHDPCEVTRFDVTKAGCYWDAHRKDFALGVDGWWPDEGDSLDPRSRLTRNRMYWEGPQMDRPDERPYALHRNGYAGMQRYGAFLWSGDVYSTWETLRIHVSNGINTALTGIPYWGTDIGGFVPTAEFTAELYLRWFQFAAFCPLFRAHGRAWKLRLPWGWNTGDTGPTEINNYPGAAVPNAKELHNPEVEEICRKYLELRYRMLPYLYSVVRECTVTGMPIVRALWLHFPDDAAAVARGDEYLWGSSILVAPVVERGAVSRKVYLPRGTWVDFWTGERVEGAREITRKVDLQTIPLYVRTGSIIPMGPVKQYTSETVDKPLSLSIYPGADAKFLLYEDDGLSFRYRAGEWLGIEIEWHDDRRLATLQLARGSRMLPPHKREFEVRVDEEKRRIAFNGSRIAVQF